MASIFSSNPILNSVKQGATGTIKAVPKPVVAAKPNPYLTAIGVQAKAPTDNVKTPANTLAPNQIKTTAPKTTQSTANGTMASNGTNSNAGFNSSAPGTQNVSPSGNQNITPQPTPVPTGYQPNTGLYGQLIADLANRSSQPSEAYTKAQDEVNRILEQEKNLEGEYAKQTSNLEGSGIDLSLATGQQGILNRLFAAKQGALASQYSGATNQLSAANTQQGLLQQALQQAGSLAAPQQVSYSNQFLSPLTGQSINGGMSGSLNDAVQSVVSKLQSGSMTYNDALSALSGYGQGGVNALQQALPQGFNISQSNTLSGQQGSIKPAYDYAKTALTNLENTLGSLGMLQTTGVPALNQAANWFSSKFGLNSQATSAYKAAVAEARGAIQKLLASTQGGTPTDYVSQSSALLPDEPTPQQIKAARETLEKLGGAKVDIYGNPGTSTAGNSGGGTTSAGGYSFKLVNGKWVPA